MSKGMRLKAQIKNIAHANHVPAQAVLQNFMLERLLERLSVSKYRELFVLKGGMLIAAMIGVNNRTTMDMDVTLRGYPLAEETLHNVMREICAIALPDEVMLTVGQISAIRDTDEYGGYRIGIMAIYETIRVPLQMDITTGDVITPGAIRYSLRSNFEDKQIEVWAYNRETILAEKIETILRRGVLNTRPRDFYDVYVLTRLQPAALDKQILKTALQATSEKRGSVQVLQDKEEILQAIRSDSAMRARWERYCQENYYARGIEFDEVIETLLTTKE